MTILEFVLLIIIAAICGSLGMAISGYSRGGCLMAIAVGFIGALLGTWLSRAMSLPELLTVEGFPVIWSIIGAALFVAVISLLTGWRRNEVK